MISGIRGRVERYLGAVACAVFTVAATGAEFGPRELMQVLAGVERTSARFVETRHSVLLKSPLVLSGTLAYRRPDSLEKHVLSPYDERIVIEGKQVTIENRARGWKKTLLLATAPAIAGLVESIRATRAGEIGTLERYYRVEVEGDRQQWWLRLRPHDPEIAEYVSAVMVSGSDARIERVEVHEASGDHIVMDVREDLE